MIWLVQSGDLEDIIKATKEELETKILEVLDKQSDDVKIGELLSAMPLCGWTDDNNPDEITDATLYMHTINMLKRNGRWDGE